MGRARGLLVVVLAGACGGRTLGDTGGTGDTNDPGQTEESPPSPEPTGEPKPEPPGCTGECCEPEECPDGKLDVEPDFKFDIHPGEDWPECVLQGGIGADWSFEPPLFPYDGEARGVWGECIVSGLVAEAWGAQVLLDCPDLTEPTPEDAPSQLTLTVRTGPVADLGALTIGAGVGLQYYSEATYEDMEWFSLRPRPDNTGVVLGGAKGSSPFPVGVDVFVDDFFWPLRTELVDGLCPREPHGTEGAFCERGGVLVSQDGSELIADDNYDRVRVDWGAYLFYVGQAAICDPDPASTGVTVRTVVVLEP